MKINRRQRTLISALCALILLSSVIAGGLLVNPERTTTHLELRHLPPSWAYPFGTDWLGRDMLTRTLQGLTLSIGVALLAATVSTLIALILGMLAATMGKAVDAFITWLIDLFLAVPHLVLLLLIAFTLGGGIKGILVGIALTHWPSLARIVRAEVMQLRSAEFIHVSRRLGKSPWWIVRKHLLPHLLPQLFVGFILLFPHAILHEAAVTFLGFGLSPHQPALGIILSEAMRYLSTGMWWLAFFPGVALLIVVLMFNTLGDNLRKLTDPYQAHD